MSVCQSHFQQEMLWNCSRDLRYVASHANEWNDAKKALKLPTLLEGEALAVWIELTDDEQKDYAVTKKKMIDAIMPM